MPLVIKTVVINRVLLSSRNNWILSEVSCSPQRLLSASWRHLEAKRGRTTFCTRRSLCNPQTFLVYRQREQTARRASYSTSLVESAETGCVGTCPAHTRPAFPMPR